MNEKSLSSRSFNGFEGENLLEVSNSESSFAANFDRLLNQLTVGDFQSRWEAMKSISNLGTAVIPPLLDLLQEDTDWQLLWFVARILGNLEDPAAVAALINLLHSTDNPEIATVASSALAQQGRAAILPLTQLLENPNTRLFAVQALAQIRHTEVVLPLLSVVQDPSPTIRAAAIEALSHFHDPLILPVLLSALSDRVAAVRQVSVMALGMQSYQFSDKSSLIHHLKPLLRDLNLEVCRHTTAAFGRIGTTDAVVALAELVQAPHTPLLLQLEAVRALAQIESTTAIDCLQQFLFAGLPASTSSASTSSAFTHSLEVSQEIVMLLGRVTSSEARQAALPILQNLIATAHPLTQQIQGKQAIALSLGQLGQLAAVDTLIQLLADPAKSVQLHAIAALKQLAPDLAYQKLHALATQPALPENLRQGISIALQEWQM